MHLNHIPDWPDAESWIQQGLSACAQMSDPKFCYLEFKDFVHDVRQSKLGYYADEGWRKFVLATFLADLISYPKPVDQVVFNHLCYVMHRFPEGFRILWAHEKGQGWPVGYTAWIPMLEAAFELFEKSSERLVDRTVVPHERSVGQSPFIYLFNYSVAPQFKKTVQSKELVQKYAEDVMAQRPKGLAAINVSAEGIRVAERFGMQFSGEIQIDGAPEQIYVRRF